MRGMALLVVWDHTMVVLFRAKNGFSQEMVWGGLKWAGVGGLFGLGVLAA
jgi:hypothetical protein